MLKNTNKTVVKRISIRSLKENRIRNTFAILAIILTTFMFTSVFTIGFSLAKNMRTMMLREQGSKATIFLNNPTEEQTERVKSDSFTYAAGINIYAGFAEMSGSSDTKINLNYYDETEFNKNYLPAISDVTGNYPAEKDEIMFPENVLEALNINPKIGQKITLTTERGTESFRLSGWFKNYESISRTGLSGLVSEKYITALGLTAQKNGMLSISAVPGRQSELVERLDKTLTLDKNQEIYSLFDIQSENSSNTFIIIIAFGFIGLLIVLSGYLLIYNIMYISVTKNIRFYGMLKTIGASPKQIRSIVRRQAFHLSVIGIPVGIILGTLVSFIAVPYALEIFDAGSGPNSSMPNTIAFNPLIYIITILFGILTVTISQRKPAKLAGKIAPVEALKYNGQNQEKIRPKKSTNGGKLYKMAFRNVFREKKRAILVFASLFMGTMAFLSTNAFIRCMDLKNYVKYYLPNDYTIYMDSNEENIDSAKRFADEIKAIDGITELTVNYCADVELVFDENLYRPILESDAADENDINDLISFYKKNPYSTSVVAISPDVLKKYNRTARQKIDIEQFEKGEACIISSHLKSIEDSEKMTGKTITIKSENGTDSIDIKSGACLTMTDNDKAFDIAYLWNRAGAPECIIVSKNALDKLTSNPYINSITMNCNEHMAPYVTSTVKNLINTCPAVVHSDIKSEIIQDFKSSMTSMNILTSGISLTLILIGIINFINVMLTGVWSRRTELAVMESVGMTKKQVRKMLMSEGLCYAFISILLIGSIGNAIIYFVVKLAMQVADYAVYNYPVLLMLAMFAAILLICAVVPALVYRIISKESITDRLKNIE
ncbi:MAG: ABC transporter permease [Lachnospiraceae bacterium]|jgi:putative ABC transport system permease protein